MSLLGWRVLDGTSRIQLGIEEWPPQCWPLPVLAFDEVSAPTGRFVLLSDGVAEVENVQGEIFGFEPALA